jgi:hypothetical protein
MRQQTVGWSLVLLVVAQVVLPSLALPASEIEGRKFAVKPSSEKKKVTADVNEITPVKEDNAGGFSFASVINMLAQMLLGSTNVDKADSGLNIAQGGFNWMSLVNLGLRLMLSTLNGNGVDKADSQSSPSSPMQAMMGPILASLLGGQEKADVAGLAKQAGNLIQLLASLMDALKVSFSQRSNNARSLGTKDPFSDAAVAAVTIMKGYVNTHKTQDEVCMQRIICESNSECARDAPDSGYLFCQLGTYGASYLLEKSSFTPLDAFTQAGRQGRTGENCAQIYHQCNEL